MKPAPFSPKPDAGHPGPGNTKPAPGGPVVPIGPVLKRADAVLIIAFSLIPLLLHFPYRVNIFLSWEGAYRLYLGQVPYRDFGLPMGFGYWILPALFFKLFGPSMLSLIKAQVLLNVMVGFSFRGLLRRLGVPLAIRTGAVLTLCLSYILINFWPWYNNTDIIYGIVGLNLLLCGLLSDDRSALGRYSSIAGAAFFLFLSFFTKQDGGFLMFALAAALVGYMALAHQRWKEAGFFFLCYMVIALLIILPFTRYSFGYWFNHGQAPHTARLSPRDIITEFLGYSQWIKFYILLIVLVVLAKVQKAGLTAFWKDRNEMLFLLLTLGMLATAAVFQVTSYTPPDNNIFFHAFAIAYILAGIAELFQLRPEAPRNLAFILASLLLWWSGSYWKYLDRITARVFPAAPIASVSPTGENVINRNTYMINPDTTHYEDESTWKEVPGMKAFRKIYLPPSTVAGIQRLREMPEFAGSRPGFHAISNGFQDGHMHGEPDAGWIPHVLNMSELTPLAKELNFTEDRGSMEPLWYHLGVCMFNREADTVCARIMRKEYDVVLFEYVPVLNNFYPFRVRDSLQRSYRLVDSFLAPRRPTNGYIEVYRR